jgi:carbonic anhydrase
MTSPAPRILAANRAWVSAAKTRDPLHFERMAAEHRPHSLFIGCSDARVPANVITQTAGGELFVHRNIANQVSATDPNVAAVIEYAIHVLGVTDVIVCGHYGCGGVRAAMGGTMHGFTPHVDSWLANVRTVLRLHDAELSELADAERYRRLVELNVIEQVHNIARAPAVQTAWAAGARPRIHGWVYSLREGLLRDLDVTLDGADGAAGEARAAAVVGSIERARAAGARPAAAV